ncbi:hypothetical protein FBZ93_12282 [Bradyrhizobium macuxiense]|uniref:Uncharacterized protein n=1 Tax=Bradyrhizobium macuxiense TaxID=1755647 RepID=A0A560KVN1_9BRAD|nr:hypothetical protein FBZ93_12282 [Bradyrhizobium macuxiense]
MDVEAFGPEATVECLDEHIVGRLAIREKSGVPRR